MPKNNQPPTTNTQASKLDEILRNVQMKSEARVLSIGNFSSMGEALQAAENDLAEARAAIEALLVEARQAARLQLRDELLSLGHGGGNWRRLIMSVGRPVALRKQSKESK